MDMPGVGNECEHFMDIEGWPERMLTEEPEVPRRAGELEPGEEVTFGGSVQQTSIKGGPHQGLQPAK